MNTENKQTRIASESEQAVSLGYSWRRQLLISSVWLVPGFLQCVQEVTWAQANTAREISVGSILTHFLPAWLPWALFTPLVLRLANRFPIRKGQLARSLPIHSLACLFFGLVHISMLGFVRTQFPPGEVVIEFEQWFLRTLWSLHSQAEILAYAGVVAVGHTLDALQASRRRELQSLVLERQLTEARLSALQGQLQPHFLFNTLNSIDVLMQTDQKKAGEMLHLLGDLLRQTLKSHALRNSLRDELKPLRSYLEIEQIRFSDRLEVSIEIEEQALDYCVPSLIVQPLVENAIQHGIAPLARGGKIAVQAKLVGERLEVTVVDDGVGLREEIVESIGLGNTRARLLELYGDAHKFQIVGPESGGVRASFEIPAERATGATVAPMSEASSQ